MTVQSLGEAIRTLRAQADLSLRELAKKAEISAPFLSDIELGKRYPSDDTLRNLARTLRVTFEALKKYDHRDSVTDLKKLIETNPRLGFAFRTAVNDCKNGKLTVDQFEQRVKGTKRESR